MSCPHCCKRKNPNDATCGRSHCQEAAYYANAARVARKGKRKDSLLDKVREIELMILERNNRHAGV